MDKHRPSLAGGAIEGLVPKHMDMAGNRLISGAPASQGPAIDLPRGEASALIQKGDWCGSIEKTATADMNAEGAHNVDCWA
jgi:hypothetical protein